MVNTSIRLGVALATLFNVAVVTANENPLSLDTTGEIANDTGFARMLEDENGFDHGSSITEKKKSEKCTASRLCTDAGGSCIKSNTVCDGRVDNFLCKGKKCKCCIPDTSQTEMFNAEHTESENLRSLDTTGGFLRMLEKENNLDHWNSTTERKNCPAGRQCTKAGGSCIKSKAVCDGRVDPLLCKGKKCKCCITDQSTLAPATCPTSPAPSTCPTCPAPSTCPTTPAPSSCPTCPSPSTCPTSLAPSTCPTCLAPSTCPTTPAPSTCPTCPAPSTCPTCPAPSTCPTCPAPSTTTPVITTTPALTTTTVPPGFEIFNNKLIRRPIRSDPYTYWDAAMNFCNQFGATPFIPRGANDYAFYKTVRVALDRSIWLPANDRAQEGTLRWYNNAIATNIGLWDWLGGQELRQNAESRNCLLYGWFGRPSVAMYGCNATSEYRTTASPPICEVL